MSPIENVLETNGHVNIEQKQNKSREVFGVQLEVVSLLLEAERRKLSVLQKELQLAIEEGGSIKAKEHQKQELLIAIARIQAQYELLDKEYRQHAIDVLLTTNIRGSGKEAKGGERPKIAPKPAIPTKPKFVPPVKLQQRLLQENVAGKKEKNGGDKCDKYPFSYTKKPEEILTKTPQSPSTVCCSILSNATTECCGMIHVNKKELNQKMTKLDSVDSNSSDSGGFKDFIPLDRLEDWQTKSETETRHCFQPKPANAQALAQFLPQTEQKLLLHKQAMERENELTKLSLTANKKTEEVKTSIKQGQFQQSTKKLEALLAQRLEKQTSLMRKGQQCLIDGESNQDVEQMVVVQKQIQQKLQADLQQTVKQMQEIQSIEFRLPQNRKWAESNRSQPAIGLKHTPKLRIMDDPEIQETVESILGKGAKVVDCEKKSSIKEEEVLFINGIPVALEDDDGMAVKEALVTGQIPPCDLLNTLLIKTGILKAPVKLDTSLSVKSTTVTKEEVKVSRAGRVVDERSRETKQQNFYSTTMTEIFEPVKVIPITNSNSYYEEKFYDNGGYETEGERRKYGSYSSASSYESEEASYQPSSKRSLSKDSVPSKVDFTPSSNDSLSSSDETDYITDQFKKCTTSYRGSQFLNQNNILPTIFGTVAYELTPKDCSNRRSLPQTPQNKSYSNIFNSDVTHEKDESFQRDNALVYREGNLISGPLEALIQHMVPTDVYYPDRAYLFAFLLSSRLFIKPHDLLAKVRNLCETQQGLGNGQSSTHPGQTKFAENLVQLLAEWTETFPYDFRDERMTEHVRKITQQCCAINSSLRTNISSLLHNLHQRLTALEAYESSLENLSVTNESFVDVSELCPNPATLAQQLTHIELERLSFIGPEEFVQAFAKENPSLDTSFKDMKKTHNLEQYVQWFNRLSYFVATQVCKYQKKKMRVKVVEYWIETGRECFNIGNFNSLMAIIAGLNMSPISRLKKTWNKIHSGKFAILEHQMDPSSNFSSYRSTLKAAMWRSAGATDQRQRIVIPFFSLLVKDLYFLNQGCSNRLPNDHINFEKFWQLAKQVTEFMAWKQVTCPFEKDPKILAMLQHGPILNENALALASFECEPPDNNQEKERCKNLKADVGTASN